MSKSTALKQEEKKEEYTTTEIIPWPEEAIFKEPAPKKQRDGIRLDAKYIYYKGKQIPILQFQKAGYDKLLKLLVKEIGG